MAERKEEDGPRALNDSDSTPKGSISGNKVHDVESHTGVVLSDETAHVIDVAAERALCRKFDFRLLPVLAVMVSDSYLHNPVLDFQSVG